MEITLEMLYGDKPRVHENWEEINRVLNKLVSYDVTLKWHQVNVWDAGRIYSYDCVFDARQYHDLAIVKQGTGQILDGFSDLEFYDKDHNVIATYSLPPRYIPASTLEELKVLVQKQVDLVLNEEYRKGLFLGRDAVFYLLKDFTDREYNLPKIFEKHHTISEHRISN